MPVAGLVLLVVLDRVAPGLLAALLAGRRSSHRVLLVLFLLVVRSGSLPAHPGGLTSP